MPPGIVLMSRVPQPGATKTRLQGFLSPLQCAEFHQACLFDEIQVVSQLGWPTYFCFTGEPKPTNSSLQSMEAACGLRSGLLSGWQLLEQTGKNLGQRMQNAIGQVLIKHEGAIIIGSDLPWLTVDRLEKAAWLLQKYDAVIGPALDGGYYLLGLKSMEPGLFADLPWGTDQVLRLTQHKLAEKGLSYSLLPEEQDLDTEADVHNFYQRGKADNYLQQLVSYKYLSKVMAVDNEIVDLEQAIPMMANRVGEGEYELD